MRFIDFDDHLIPRSRRFRKNVITDEGHTNNCVKFYNKHGYVDSLSKEIKKMFVKAKIIKTIGYLRPIFGSPYFDIYIKCD